MLAEEQGFGDVLDGEAFRGCYSLDHVGEGPSEIDHKILKLDGPLDGDAGDDLADGDLAVPYVVVVGLHSDSLGDRAERVNVRDPVGWRGPFAAGRGSGAA